MLTCCLCGWFIGDFEEASGEINFREISSSILEKVIQYFYYKLKYSNATSEIPEFRIEYVAAGRQAGRLMWWQLKSEGERERGADTVVPSFPTARRLRWSC